MSGKIVLIFIITLLIAGVMIGADISQIDLLNLPTSRAEARRMDLEADCEAKRTAIDLEYYERERAIETKALEQQREDEMDFAERRREQQLTITWIAGIVFTSIGALVLLAVGVGLTYYLVSLGRGAQDSAREAEMRLSARQLARVNERLFRRLELFAQGDAGRSRDNGNGRYDKRTGEGQHSDAVG